MNDMIELLHGEELDTFRKGVDFRPDCQMSLFDIRGMLSEQKL